MAPPSVVLCSAHGTGRAIYGRPPKTAALSFGRQVRPARKKSAGTEIGG